MNKLILILPIVAMLIFTGCEPDESKLLEDDTITAETAEEPVVEKIVEKVIEAKEPTEEILPAKTTESDAKEENTDTKKESNTETVTTKTAETKTATTTTKPNEPKTYVGQIGNLDPIKNGMYNGELTILDTSYKHYDFISKIQVFRGDKVKFTLSKDYLATVVEKIFDERAAQTAATAKTVEVPLPANAKLGRIKSVITSVNTGFNGKVIDAQTGDEYRYESQTEFTINQFVYFVTPKLSTGNAEIIKKA